VTQGGSTTESYTYDPVGNRLTSLGSSSWSYNTSNELISRPSYSYTYDYNGSTQTMVNSSGTTTYAWDFENRLTSVVLPGSGGTVYFKNDPFGRRIYKSSSSGTSIYAYDGDNLIEETNSSGASVARYSQGLNIDEPLVMLRSGTTSYYQADGLGSLTSLSNTSGALVSTYDSFGNLVASSGSLVNSFRYTGREFDTETGLYYYRARYYDPATGRFLSEDPAGLQGGPNRYAYALGTPTNLVDPSGRISSVTQIGNTITVTASITLYGPNATTALAEQWQNDINSVWNNYGSNFTYGNCVVNFNVRVIADPTANHWFTAAVAGPAQNYVYVVPDPNFRSGFGNPPLGHEGHMMGQHNGQIAQHEINDILAGRASCECK